MSETKPTDYTHWPLNDLEPSVTTKCGEPIEDVEIGPDFYGFDCPWCTNICMDEITEKVREFNQEWIEEHGSLPI